MAASCFERALEFDPTGLPAHKALAVCRLRLGQIEAGFKTLADLSKALGPDFEGHYELGIAYEQLHRPSLAEEEFRKALEAKDLPLEHRQRAMLALARALIASGKKEEALSWYQKALDESPELPAALAGLGNCYAALGRHAEAVGVFRRYIEAQKELDSPESVTVLTALAAEYEKLKKEDEGAALFDEYVRRAPHQLQLRQLCILLHQKAGQRDAAVAQAEEYLKLEPNAHTIRLLLAGIYTSENKPAEAIRVYAFIMASDTAGPNMKLVTANRLSALATQLLNQKEHELALAALEPIISAQGLPLDPQRKAEFLLGLAAIYEHMKRLDDAVKMVRQALATYPQRWQAHVFLVHLLLRRENHSEAEAILQKALSSFGNDNEALAELHATLASVYESMTQRAAEQERAQLREKVEAALKAALQANPRHPNANNHLGYLYALQNRNLEEAVKLVEVALKAHPKEPAFLDSLGWALYKIALRDDSPEVLKSAIEKLMEAAAGREDPVILDHLGDALFVQGQWEEARVRWQKSLELIPTADPSQERPDPAILRGKLSNLEELLKSHPQPESRQKRPLAPPTW